jgi:hypothetical protein
MDVESGKFREVTLRHPAGVDDHVKSPLVVR